MGDLLRYAYAMAKWAIFGSDPLLAARWSLLRFEVALVAYLSTIIFYFKGNINGQFNLPMEIGQWLFRLRRGFIFSLRNRCLFT